MRNLLGNRITALILIMAVPVFLPVLPAQDTTKDNEPPRGSIAEDRAARKLLEAGDARLQANEANKAIEVWQSVIERYPRSRVRYDAHLRLGNYLLERERAFDRARTHFEAVSVEENSDQPMRAQATLKIGVCFYEARNFGKCFQIMRDVIEKFPVSPEVNQAHYYIGLGHFQLGHYSRAITALEKVGTALGEEESKIEKCEAGKRLFVRIEDADLAVLEVGQTVKVTCKSASGDSETMECHAIGRNVRVVLGSIPTTLGKPKPGNGILEIRGNDKVEISYVDLHTSEGKGEKIVRKDIAVVGNAIVSIMDGAFAETLGGVVLGKPFNIQITDADFDLTDDADVLKATVEVYREKSPEELGLTTPNDETKDKNSLDRYKRMDGLSLILKESRVNREVNVETVKEENKPGDQPSTKPQDEDTGIHSGVFRTTVQLVNSDIPNDKDDVLQALPGDLIVITYNDPINTSNEPKIVQYRARCVEGSLGGVRVTQTQISDQELRVKTQLKTASALTNIGNRYKEFGLKQLADKKYDQGLLLCEEIMGEARKLGGRTLEETYVQLWKIYYEMDKLDLAAAMSQRLQREFPNSEFVDEALLQLAQVSRKQGQLQRAIGIYGTITRMPKSALRGEAQFGIAECYEDLARGAEGAATTQLFDQSFQEYKKVFDLYPDSGRVGEAVAKMANYYYQQKDYARAVDVFENVLATHPDAKYLDVILFNYGRCLFRMDRKPQARKQFDQLIGEFPESPLAADAKKISEALRKQGF